MPCQSDDARPAMSIAARALVTSPKTGRIKSTEASRCKCQPHHNERRHNFGSKAHVSLLWPIGFTAQYKPAPLGLIGSDFEQAPSRTQNDKAEGNVDQANRNAI